MGPHLLLLCPCIGAANAAPESLSPKNTALRERIVARLEEQRRNINAVARLMGKDRTQIRRWLIALTSMRIATVDSVDD